MQGMQIHVVKERLNNLNHQLKTEGHLGSPERLWRTLYNDPEISANLNRDKSVTSYT